MVWKRPPPEYIKPSPAPALCAVQIPYLLRENQDLLQAFSTWTTLIGSVLGVIVVILSMYTTNPIEYPAFTKCLWSAC